MSEDNLFSLLGKYVERQNENLLTQSLAALFQHCGKFRTDFLGLLEQKSGDRALKVADASCRTQSPKRLKDGRILVDLEICCNGEDFPKYVVEAKVSAPLTRKQAKHYSEILKRRRGKSRLVLLTRGGVDSELKKLLPKDTLWLTWTELGDLARHPGHKTKVERFLCRQFHELLQEKGIPMVKPITSGEYKKIGVLNRFVAGKYRGLTQKNFDVINNIMARMRVLVDDNWKGLVYEGYKPYGRLYRIEPSKKNGAKKVHAEIEVGFFLWKTRKAVRERCICLTVDCTDMRLYAWGGWTLGRDHPKHDTDPGGEDLKEWTKSRSRELFKMPLQNAQREMEAHLQECLKRFKKSHYYKA